MRAIKIIILLFLSSAAMSQVNADFLKTDISVHGTSTLHDWKSDVRYAYANADIDMIDGELVDITNMVIKIKAEDIKSEKGSMMDKNTYKALKTNKHPYIFVSMTRTSSIVKTNNQYKIKGIAQVSISGVAKTVEVDATAYIDSNGDIMITGSETIKMTDFGVEPPVVLMGTLKTGNEVTIKYSCVLPCVAETCL